MGLRIWNIHAQKVIHRAPKQNFSRRRQNSARLVIAQKSAKIIEANPYELICQLFWSAPNNLAKKRSSFALGAITTRQSYAFAIDAEGELSIKTKMKCDRVLELLAEHASGGGNGPDMVCFTNSHYDDGVLYAINFKSPPVELMNLKDYQEKIKLVFKEIDPVFVDKGVLNKIVGAKKDDLPSVISDISANIFKVQREKRAIGSSVQGALDQKDP